MNDHLDVNDVKLEVYVLIGAMGVALILLADIVYMIFNNGVKMIGRL
jgi:hypothetical protein